MAAAVGGAVISGVAANSAANTQAGAAKDAANIQLNEYNQTRTDLAPWVAGGNLALTQLEKSLGLISSGSPAVPGTTTPGTPGGVSGGYTLGPGSTGGNNIYGPENSPAAGVEQQATVLRDPSGQVIQSFPAGTPQDQINAWLTQNNIPMTGGTAATTTPGTPATTGNPFAGFQSSPGYQFQLNQGMGAINNSASARGGVNSGATLKSLQQFGTGLANQDWYNYLNQLTGLSGSGQNAAAQTGAFGAQAATGAGNNLVGAANASAAGTVGTANSMQSLLANLAALYKNGGGGGAASIYNSPNLSSGWGNPFADG